MTSNAIPDRSTSRYAGQYSRAIDASRLLEIFTDSHKIALSSKTAVTAQSRFELAIETYHQLISMGLSAENKASLQGAMNNLVAQFPIQICLNEAAGLCGKANKLKSAQRKLQYLVRAQDILRNGLATIPARATAIQVMHDDVAAEIASLKAITGQ